jgi:hypothetical protein
MTTSVNAYPGLTDEEKAISLFLGMGNTITGPDQTYIGMDGTAVNPTGQYRMANPDGSYSVQGLPRSNLQSFGQSVNVGGMQLPGVLVLGLIGYVLMKVVK